jgi:hypothetical protein
MSGGDPMNALIANLDRGVAVTLGVMALAGAAWVIAIVASLLSRAAQPKKGLRPAEMRVIGASLVFMLSVGATLWAASAAGRPKVETEAAKPAKASRGTCASLRVGMKSGEVKREMGEPDEIRSEEDVRGPEAEAWVYRASRCSVHVLSGKVDFID